MKKSPIVIFLLCVLLFSSCKKGIENKIDGVWRITNIANASSNEYDEWHIENGYFYVEHISANGSHSQTSQGEYKIKDKIYNFRRIFSVTKSTNNNLIDDWRIKKLTNEYLTLRSSNGGIFLEFTKQ